MVRVQLQPKHPMLIHKLSKWCLLSLLMGGCQLFQGPTHRAELFLGAGQYDEAIEELSQREVTDPEDDNVQQLLARAYRSRAAMRLSEKDCAAALSDYESAASRSPRLSLNYRLTEACFTKRQQPVPPNLAQILLTFGDLKTATLTVALRDLMNRNELAKAEPIARTLAARQVWNESDARLLAAHALDKEIYHAARYWLLKLVWRRPNDAYLMTRAAMVSMELKDYETAHRLFTRVYSERPKNRVFLASWRKACTALELSTCIRRIDELLKPASVERELRALPKSRR